MQKYVIILFLFLLATSCLNAQSNDYVLDIQWVGQDTVSTVNIKKLAPACDNATTCQTALSELLIKLKQDGYLAASIDSLFSDSTQTIAYLFLGEQYQWAILDKGNVSDAALQAVGFKAKYYTNKRFEWRTIQQLQRKLLAYYENNGFPFAKLQLKEVFIDDNGTVQAQLWADTHDRIKMDSLLIRGEVKISKRYLRTYLGLKQGDIYNEAKIKAIPTRLKELPFLQSSRSPEVNFIKRRAEISVFLQKKKASKFNFLVGVLPQSGENNLNGQRKLNITGEGDLLLHNALGAGELLEIDFRSYPQQTQELNLHVLYPYLPLLPIGADVQFGLYKRDSSFRDVISFLGLQYTFSGNNYLKAFFKNKNSAILNIDSNRLKTTKQLPDFLDVSHSTYGLELNYEQLDYRLNPKKGWQINLVAGVGSKRVKENVAVLEIGERLFNDADTTNFQQQYEQLNQSRFQLQLQYQADRYWQLGRRSTVKTGVRGAFTSDKNASQNELYRIGGNNLLRGFDDQSILASWYNVATVEFRYLLSQNSYFFLFGDGAYRQTISRSTLMEVDQDDFPFGFGAGVTFETKAGVFGISYALGSQQGNPIEVRNGKVHFGYVNYF